MKVFKFSLIKYVACFLIFSCSSVFSSDLVEEGWRYHKNLQLRVTYKSKESPIDLAGEHHAMAEAIRHNCPSKDKYTCLLRFIPVIVKGEDGEGGEKEGEGKGEGICYGQTICLTEAPFHERNPGAGGTFLYNELGFISGFEDQHDSRVIPYKSTYSFVFARESVKTYEDAFSIFPASMAKESFPASMVKGSINRLFALKVVQRSYINSELLGERLDFRYPTGPLHDACRETKEKLKEKSKTAEKLLNTAKNLLLCGDIEGATKVMANNKNADRLALKNITSNSKMGSYTCAEQCGLDFLWDIRVLEYLKRTLRLDDHRVKGIIINAHCSHTPCCSCATAFSREIVEGGVFKNIFKLQKIFFICSAQNPYLRPATMIPYANTNFIGEIDIEHLKSQVTDRKDSQKLEELKNTEFNRLNSEMAQVSQFNLGEESSIAPYPVILMEYKEECDEFGNYWGVDNKLVDNQLEKQVNRLVSPLFDLQEESSKKVKNAKTSLKKGSNIKSTPVVKKGGT